MSNRKSSELRRELEEQLNRPAKVLKTAHIPRHRQKPKFQVQEPEVHIVICDDIVRDHQEKGPDIVGFEKYEVPMKFGDVDAVKVPVADSGSVVTSEETAEPQAVAVSEEVSANSESDKPQSVSSYNGPDGSDGPVYRNIDGDVIGPYDEVACNAPGETAQEDGQSEDEPVGEDE